MFDVAIVGAGPAAVSAALNLKLHNKDFVWFGSLKMSQKVEKSERIANYPGVPMVTGVELNQKFLSQVQEMEIELTDRMVTNITKTKKGFMLLADNEIFEAKAVLLCIGATAAKGFIGEEEALGRGVSYCATCDGFLYKEKKIAVFAGDKRYEHEVEYLADLASEVVLFAPYQNCEVNRSNVTKAPAPMKEILTADGKVSAVKLSDGTEIAVEGAFILRNSVAPANLLSGLQIEGPHIVVDREMKTNIAGCFAAGDCIGRPYQIAKAVGDGNVAAHTILDYLAECEKEQA